VKGDFSSFKFKPGSNYLSVFKQQGRVDLDSDWNEQTEIWNERQRQLICDLLGGLAVPLCPNKITPDNSSALKIDKFSRGPGGIIDFSIGCGIAYIGGFPCWFENNMMFKAQPDYPEPEIPEGTGDILAYVEVWNKTINYIDDETIREPALGGPDTCLRKKLIAQVKFKYVPDNIDTPGKAEEHIRATFTENDLLLTLKIEETPYQIPISFGEVDMGGGLIPGNLHFRIELHRGVDSDGGYSEGFKWSDENAATVVRVLEVAGSNSLVVEEAEAVTGESLKVGDWVEISNFLTEHHRQGGHMARIDEITQDETGLQVILDSEIHPLLRRFQIGGRSKPKYFLAPRLRRWAGYISPVSADAVYDLGRGIKATFHYGGKKYDFHPGNYWTFAIRDRAHNKRFAPQKALPDGVDIYRHPLAIIKFKGKKQVSKIIDCRRFFKPMVDFV
jgi:hypothetical protein